jgi:hypothetical protein
MAAGEHVALGEISMGDIRLTLSLAFTLALAGVAEADPHSDIWKSLANEPEWRLTYPAYLYLAFVDNGVPGESLTWLHPLRHRSNWCEEAFMPRERREARAFAYHLTRETPQGYEVSFQPVDPIEPWTERPIAGKAIKVFFPRSERKRFKLTDKLSVVGFYGSPQRKRP